ncbi:MAG: hypothetical protein LBB56_00895 [Chitinispirillales bacterium]|jgi:hypothetical protein|nr:hypothetical protein [Chitinispirillales bacterium]
MRNFLFIILLFICAPSAIFSDEIIADTTQQEQSLIVQDNVTEETILDTALSSQDTVKEIALSDSLTDTPLREHTKLAIIRREHDYKRQAWMAAGMMTFLAIILGTSQSWNPR